MQRNRKWPENCVWPAPIGRNEGMQWDADIVDPFTLNEEGRELFEVKDYFDALVESGRLNDDYTLNEGYDLDDEDADEEEDKEEFEPEIGEDYWDENRFQLDLWEDDLTELMNTLKIDLMPYENDPAIIVRDTIGYEFINENLMRQAFTRRAFAVEYGLSGSGEELEFIGDSVLNLIVTKQIVEPLTSICEEKTEAPFTSPFDEGALTRMRTNYTSKEYLNERFSALGLDRFILYGNNEKPSESSREDALEALIGAVTIDSGWDWTKIETVIDRMICVQETNPERFLKTTYYELLNSWHQKHFGHIPDYEISGSNPYRCTLRFSVPDNTAGIRTAQRIDVDGTTRSKARERAATLAYYYITEKGLWINLKDANIVPNLENSINQLQELYQKKYVESAPTYEFQELTTGEWFCTCVCNGVSDTGYGNSKTKAKKKAAYATLLCLFRGAGICDLE